MHLRWLALVVLLAACSRKRAPTPSPSPSPSSSTSTSARVLPTTAEAMTCRDGELGVAEPGGFGEGGLGLSGLGDTGHEVSVVIPVPVYAGRRPVVVQGAPTPSPASGTKAGALAVGACAAFPALRVCYDAALAIDPELEGTLDVQLTLDASGRAVAVERTATQLTSAVLEACALRALGAQTFPKEAAGTATYALRFRAPRARDAGH